MKRGNMIKNYNDPAYQKVDLTKLIQSNKSVYAIKNSDNEYFIGYGKWDKQIRKAKLYHATNWAEEVMNDPRFNGLDLKVVKVIIYEEE